MHFINGRRSKGVVTSSREEAETDLNIESEYMPGKKYIHEVLWLAMTSHPPCYPLYPYFTPSIITFPTNTYQHPFITSSSDPLPRLDALRVVGVENRASRARDAGGRASPADTTTLSPLWSRSTARSSSGSGLRSRGGGSSGSRGSGSSDESSGALVSWGRRRSTGGVLAREGGSAGSGGNRLALSDGAGDTGDESGSRDRVTDWGGIGVEQNTRVGGAVERSTGDTSGRVVAASGDTEVEALRIGLSSVGAGSAVKGEDLVAEDVVARLQVRGDLDKPAVAVGAEGIGSPAVIVAASADLEEAERSRVDVLAGTIAVGKIVDNGANVRLGPFRCPDDRDLVASGDGGMALAGLGTLVTDDVGRTKVVGLNETVVLVKSRPTNHIGGRARVVEVGGGIIVAVVVTVDNDVANVAVGRDEGGTGQRSEEGRLGSHVDDCGGLETCFTNPVVIGGGYDVALRLEANQLPCYGWVGGSLYKIRDGTSVRRAVISTHEFLIGITGTIPPQYWRNATEVGEVGRPTTWNRHVVMLGNESGVHDLDLDGIGGVLGKRPGRRADEREVQEGRR